MTIQVTRDPDGEAVERCFNCHCRTAYWYAPKDVACCPSCAEEVTAKDVPSKRDWFRTEMEIYSHGFGKKPGPCR